MNSEETAFLRASPPPIAIDEIALFLDLDGTLAPLAGAPGEVGPDVRRNRLLERLCERAGGRVAVISGRGVAEVDRILEGAVAAVAGVHGLERRSACGRRSATEPHADLGVARDALHAMAKARMGLFLEDKGLSVALHYRQAPASEEAVLELAQRLERATDLLLQRGRMVVELRTPGPNKGDALAAFMAEPPFAGKRPVYIGDDLTDEDAFAAAAAAGGYGVLVGPDRRSAAAWRLNDVEEVMAWLSAALTPRLEAVL